MFQVNQRNAAIIQNSERRGHDYIILYISQKIIGPGHSMTPLPPMSRLKISGTNRSYEYLKSNKEYRAEMQYL